MHISLDLSIFDIAGLLECLQMLPLHEVAFDDISINFVMQKLSCISVGSEF